MHSSVHTCVLCLIECIENHSINGYIIFPTNNKNTNTEIHCGSTRNIVFLWFSSIQAHFSIDLIGSHSTQIHLWLPIEHAYRKHNRTKSKPKKKKKSPQIPLDLDICRYIFSFCLNWHYFGRFQSERDLSVFHNICTLFTMHCHT